jgi:hypothetical protein
MKKRHSRFGGPEMEHMRVRAKLLDLLLDIARDDQLDWAALVHIFGISQPRYRRFNIPPRGRWVCWEASCKYLY